MQFSTRSSKTSPAGRSEGGLRFRGVRKQSTPGQPLITVITSTFNAAEHLGRAALSIREQAYRNVEWLVVDGGSTDGTVDVILENDDVIDYWQSEPDGGIYDAWNKALPHVTGCWVMFLGADDRLDSSWLQKVAAQELHYDLVYSNLQLLDRASQGSVFVQRGRNWNEAKRLLRQYLVLPHPGMAHAARLFAGRRFDPDFGSVADWEFLVRAQPEKGLYIDDGIQACMTLGGVSNNASGMTKAIEEYFSVVKAHRLKLDIPVRLSKLLKLQLSRFPFCYALAKKVYHRLHSRRMRGKSGYTG
jgi:glycosyltransferase involved in cell wall biosynthesis